MVQNVSTQQPNNFGVINRIGTTNNGRVIYQVVDKSGKIAGKMSVAQRDCDTFERSYSQIMRAAPKMQAYMQNTPPERKPAGSSDMDIGRLFRRSFFDIFLCMWSWKISESVDYDFTFYHKFS